MLTFAIGDIHGCRDRLRRLLARCRERAAGVPSRFVFLGDYIDRGPDSRGVIETIMALQRADPAHIVCLMGNHEQMMLDAIAATSPTALPLWRDNGGWETLDSYRTSNPLTVPRAHVEWLQGLSLSFDDGRRFYVHAGVDPDLPLDRQPPHALLWIRKPFHVSSRDYGRLIVHGHTPQRSGEPEVLPNRVNVDTAAVFGGVLTAAVFTDDETHPVAFLTDR